MTDVTPERLRELRRAAVDHAEKFPGAIRWTGGETTTEHAAILCELEALRRRVPDGYVVVPIVAPQEAVDAMRQGWHQNESWQGIYRRAVIAAAPEVTNG